MSIFYKYWKKFLIKRLLVENNQKKYILIIKIYASATNQKKY